MLTTLNFVYFSAMHVSMNYELQPELLFSVIANVGPSLVKRSLEGGGGE